MAVSPDSFQNILDIVLPKLKTTEEILAIIGLLYIGKLTVQTLFSAFIGLRAHVFSRIFKTNFVKKFGKWAVVTGCTDGIGKAYAIELAKRRMNLVLISRSLEKLVATAKEIEKFGVETEIIQIDFLDGQRLYGDLSIKLEEKDIGLLFNNVGIMLPHPKYFENVTEKEIWGHINVNMASVTAMTKIVLPGMLVRRRGAIVNMSSIAATGPIPLMGIYAASKVYVDYFTQALKSECNNYNLTIQTLKPSYVATKMTSFSKFINTPSLLTPSAERFAASAVATLGHTSYTTGYWAHGIQLWFLDIFCPAWLYMRFMKLLNLFFMRGIQQKKQ